MTPKQVRRMIRSLEYREELAQGIPFLQAQLLQYVEEHGPMVINGYRLEADRGELVIKKLPVVSLNQIPLPLEGVFDEAAIKDSEVPEICMQEGVCFVCERILEEGSPECDCPCHSIAQ